MRGSKGSRAIPAPDANAELATSMQVHKAWVNILQTDTDTHIFLVFCEM